MKSFKQFCNEITDRPDKDIPGVKPGLKDIKRMEDIVAKSGGDPDEITKLVTLMANAIHDPEKSQRRAAAARKVFGSKLGREMAEIFLTKKR